MNSNYKICKRCIMDTTDPEIEFNEDGSCNHCTRYDELVEIAGYKKGKSEKELQALVERIKAEGKNKEYDAIIGISGGVDSAYLAYLANHLGLRVLAVHVDAGWNTNIAVENIQKLCKSLKIDLHTIVIDWPTMKELQRAYLFSGLPNLDVPQDHVFLSAMYKYARRYKIKFMLNGSNLATESILPQAWGYDAMDYTSIKSVYNTCGREQSLKKYPHTSIFNYYYYQLSIKRVNLLNYVDYSKSKAIELLSKEFDWTYYGGKHYESRFTKFFQAYYLPKRFGYNKKRAHLSSLIVNGELSREEALLEMEDDSVYTVEQMNDDRDYILKKLEISIDEWREIMSSPLKREDDYRNSKKIRKFISLLRLKYRKRKQDRNKG